MGESLSESRATSPRNSHNAAKASENGLHIADAGTATIEAACAAAKAAEQVEITDLSQLDY
jgi:hypothetical protein